MPEEPGDRTDISHPRGMDDEGVDDEDKRNTLKVVGGAAAAIAGAGGLAIAYDHWSGGKAPAPVNGTNETATPTTTPNGTGTPTDTAAPTDNGTPTDTATPNDTATPTDTATPNETATPTNTTTPTDTATPQPSVPGYSIDAEAQEVTIRSEEGEFTTSYTPEDLWYNQEGSENVEFGIQESGDLVAFNFDEQIIYEFERDTHPSRDYFDFEGHPLSEIYDSIQAEVEELPEGAAEIITEDDESLEANRTYKSIEFDKLFSELSEYEGGEAMAANYLLDFKESTQRGEPIYESEFQDLLGIDQSENESTANSILSGVF